MGTEIMGTKTNSGSCQFSAGLAVGVAADVVHLRQSVACLAAAAVSFGQHLLLGIVPIVSVPISGVPSGGRGRQFFGAFCFKKCFLCCFQKIFAFSRHHPWIERSARAYPGLGE